MKSILKSIGSILAGILTSVVLSVGTDFIFEKTGFMKRDPFSDNPWWLIALVVAYRTVYNALGSYITAKLAPNYPMRHVLSIAIVGVVVGTIGTIVMWDVPPHWYPITLVILTLPTAWFGGWLALKK